MAAGTTITTTGVLYINGQQVENTFNNLRRITNTLERDLRNLTPGTREFVETSNRLDEARRRFQQLRGEINSTNQVIQETTESGSSLKNIFAGNIAADFFQKGIQLGLDLLKTIKNNVDELNEVKNTLSQLDNDLKGIGLMRATATVSALSKTYGKSVEEITVAVKGLNASTKDTNKSLDLIKRGFVAGADASGEFLTQLKEYPNMMNDAKLSAEEMIALIAQSEKLNVYDDKGIDTVKEGMLRIREGAKATKDAMIGIGIDVDDLYKKIKTGSLSYFEAIKLVSAKIKETGADSRITGTAIADIFGGPGEDSGYEFISKLHEVDLNLNKLTSSANEQAKAKQREVAANEKLNNIWVTLTATGSALSAVITSIKSGTASLLSAMFGIKQLKLSDEYLSQQNRLFYLKAQLDANVGSQEKYRNIIKELKTEFPEHFKNLSLEEKSHLKIAAAINQSINALDKKYKMQVMQEGFDEASEEFQKKYRWATDYEIEAQQKIGALLNKRKKDLDSIGFKMKSSTSVNQLEELRVALEKLDGGWSRWSVKDGDDLGIMQLRLQGYNKKSKEAQQEMLKSQKARLEYMKKNGLVDAPEVKPPTISKDTDLDADAAAKKASDAAAKKAEADRKKAEAEAKKLAEQKKKELEDSIKAAADANNRSLEAEIQYRIDKAKLLEDSYEKERLLADLERSKEFNAQRKQCDDILLIISDLEEKIANAKTPAAANFTTALEKQKKLLSIHDQIVEASEEAHQFRLRGIKEKWDAKFFEQQVKKTQREIDNNRRNREQEITDITSLEDAKSQLLAQSDLKLTDQELRAIDNLEDAKSALREAANRAMLKQQEKAIQFQLRQLSEALNDPTLSREAREKLEENLNFLKDKITEVKSAIDGGNNTDAKKVTEEQNAAKENTDILGFSAKNWEDTFNNLDTTEGKIKALGMAFQALGNAGQMFSQLTAAQNEKELRNFTKIQTEKKKELLKRLNEGYINQEEYTKETQKLEVDAANKKSELDYKQAKADKVARIFGAVGATAQAVATALTAGPIAGPILAAIVGALGAVQVGIIASQPLPERPSFAGGGFTGDGFGSPDDTGYKPAGIVHQNEWVAPEWMTQHPRTAKVIDYLESVRLGKSKPFADGGFSSDNTTISGTANTANTNESNDNLIQYLAVMSDVKELLQYLKDNGVEAWMLENAENGKRIKRTIKKFETIENSAAGK